MKTLVLPALAMLVGVSACQSPAPLNTPADPVVALQRAFAKGDTQGMADSFDYREMLTDRLGEIWTKGAPKDQERAIKQLHEMTLVTSRTAAKSYLGNRPTRLTVRYVSDHEAWVHVATTDDLADVDDTAAGANSPSTTTPENRKPFQWRYRVVRRDSVWKVVQREYRVGHHSSRTTRFYRTVVGHLRKELGRLPTLSEVVANVPSLARRMRVRTYRIPPPHELEEMRKKQAEKSQQNDL